MARRSISRRSVRTTRSKRLAASAADALIALERAERAAYRKFSDASLALDRAEEIFRATHGRSPAGDSQMATRQRDYADPGEDAPKKGGQRPP